MSLPGAFRATKKNGTVYYRSSFTFKNKHISLGSFPSANLAHAVYLEAHQLVLGKDTIDSYNNRRRMLPFEKYISLINFRDHEVYFKNPIYLEKRYFLYYVSPEHIYKFDIDDLFYYASRKISRRNGHLFVADYGMQVNLLSRYGIKSHAVKNRDYRFINGDRYDFRYENIEIINRYHGVTCLQKNAHTVYKAKILINGTFTVGTYPTETEAAIAYNKAADLIHQKLPARQYRQNYIDNLPPSQYAEIYMNLNISQKIMNL
ncbi:MAG: hypothetical protein QM697_03405 [Lachnospiraceae bacterium]